MSGVWGFITSTCLVVGVVGAVAAVRQLSGSAAGRVRGRRADPESSVLIGAIASRHGRPVCLDLDELQQGVLIGGSPGAGKTTLLTAIEQRLPAEIGCAFVDLKGPRLPTGSGSGQSGSSASATGSRRRSTPWSAATRPVGETS